MATSVKAKIDVSVSPYAEVTTGDNVPVLTTGLTSATFPSNYFGGGSFTATLDDDGNVEAHYGTLVCTSGSGSAATAQQIYNSSRSGILILKNSGYTTTDKDVASNAAADIMIHAANSNSASQICKLSVETKDVFVIPYTGQACSLYYAVNQSQTASQPALLEFCFINNEE